MNKENHKLWMKTEDALGKKVDLDMLTYFKPTYLFKCARTEDDKLEENVNVSFETLTADYAETVEGGVLLTNVYYKSDYDDLTEENSIEDILSYYYRDLGPETFRSS